MARSTDSYVLCSTPRTGSTLLCSLLQATGCAGVPESFFRSEDVETRVDEWCIRQSNGTFDFHDFVRCALDAGRSPNGMFAVRIMWETMDELVNRLRDCGKTSGDLEVLTSVFGRMKFIYLYRRDKVAQAVSRYKAEQSNIWHLTHSAPQKVKENVVAYDRESIQRYVEESIEHNLAWNDWFQRNDIEPLRIAYEDLDRDNAFEIRRALDFLGLDVPVSPIKVHNMRMADSISREWTERFRKETGFV